ncbi:Putative Phage-related protein [Mycoavidus cysteinexigens]|uniref:Phage-related protein n=2 Tax=Mycoavidus cysteinexigens TaxID=1553431 RepID=A0A2Z6ESK8_9BURK|nr:Putative Phage-related protein [Mycoavidus cysteinexigens]GLR00895.1 hypothetical protein GCM10007934_07070 [Mycoavidus cysteinexigens]
MVISTFIENDMAAKLDWKELEKARMVMALFDTLRFAKRLKNAGVSNAHAEAEAEALAEVFTLYAQELSTKEDLRLVKEELCHEMSDMRKDMDIRLANVKFDLLKWIIGLAIAQTGLVVGALTFFATKLPA